MNKLYRKIELTDEQQDTFVFPHIMAMTKENLHSKADIAHELGVRDKRIAELEKQSLDIVKLGKPRLKQTRVIDSNGNELEEVSIWLTKRDLEMQIKGLNDALAQDDSWNVNAVARLEMVKLHRAKLKLELREQVKENG